MGRKTEREYMANYTGEMSTAELRAKILKLLLEEKERIGIEGAKKIQHRDIREGEQGRLR